MGDIIQKYTIKSIADVSSVLNSIKTIQTNLDKLAIPPATKASFDNIFSNMTKQANKASELMAKGFQTRGSVTAYNNAIDQVVDGYNKLITKIEILKSKGNIELVDNVDGLKNAKKELEELGNIAKEAAITIEETQKKLSKGMLAATSDHDAKSWKEIRENFTETEVNVEAVEAAIKKLNATYKAHQTAVEKGNIVDDPEKWEQFKTDLEAVEANLKTYKETLETSAQASKDFDDQQKVVAEIEGKIAEAFKGANEGAKEGLDYTREYANTSKKAAEQTQQLSSELDSFKNKVAYFFGLSNAINLFKNAVRSAYNTVKDLDAVMTETAVVTDFSVGDMWAKLPEYTQRANELGVSIHSAYEAATIFYQQGLKTNEVIQISNETLKMARIAGLDAATASDRMTNALRGFNMEMDKFNAQRVNDVYSKLAAITASNTDEISTAMTKVASLAHNANMEFETTAAFLAQIIESTRESAETAGTALKTVVARFSEVKKLYSEGELIGTDLEGEEIDVNKVATALRSANINLNEYLTGMKGLDDIFLELAEKWDSLDIVQQRYIATMAAGSRQQSRFIALMSDYERTVELVGAANTANGASNEQYGKTLDSLETKLTRLQNAWNELMLGLANSDAIKSAVDLLTQFVTALNKLINSISGGNSTAKMLTTFVAGFTAFKVGSSIIGKTSLLDGIFGDLTKTGINLSETSSVNIMNSFSKNLANKIKDIENDGGIAQSIKNSLTGAFSKVNDYYFDSTQIRTNIFDSIDFDALDNDQAEEIFEVLNKDNLTLDELNESLALNGATFKESGEAAQITADNYKEFGLEAYKTDGKIDNLAATTKLAASASIALGAACTALGSYLESNFDGVLSDVGTAVKTVGIALTAFGTIMSVWLPLQANLMKQGVTSAIVTTPVVGWIIGIIAALTALGVAIYSIAKNHSLETKLENAEEDARNAKDAAQEAADAYEKLGEAWDNLSDKYEVIENATKGTQEWRDAVKDLNDAVLELMDSYSNVKVERDKNGILHVTNQEEVDEQVATVSANNSAAVRVANIAVLETQQEIRDRDLANTYNSGWGDASYDPIIQDLIENNKLEEIAGATYDEIYAIAKEYYTKRDEEYGYSFDDYDTVVRAIQTYAKGYSENQQSIRSETAALGSDVLNQADINDDMRKYANTLLDADYLTKIVDEESEKVIELKEDELKDAYARTQGYQTYESFKEANPEDETSIQQMRNVVTASQAIERAANQVEIFTQNVAGLSETEQALYAQQDGGALTQKQIEELRNMDIDTLYQDFGGDEVYGTQEYFEEWLNSALNNAIQGFDTSGFNAVFANKLQEDLTTGITDNLDSGTYKVFTDNLWSIYKTSGAEAMEEIESSISDMRGEMDDKEFNNFVKALNSVDWASTDSIRTLDELALEYGVSESAIKSFEDQIIDFNKTVSQVDLESLNDSIALANSIASGEQGRSFSEEDYNTAIASGRVDKSDFVIDVDTGEYVYIRSDIQAVRDAILGKTDDVIAELESLDNSNKAVEEIGTLTTAETQDYDAMAEWFIQYLEVAGEDALVSYDFFWHASLEELQEEYKNIIAEYDKSAETEENLRQERTASYQSNTAAENLALIQSDNSQEARDALAVQVSTSGLAEEFVDQLVKSIETVPINGTAGNYANQGTIQAANIMTTFEQAADFGIEADTLNEYVSALQAIEGLENARIDTLYALALANANFQEGFASVIDSYDDWIALKREDGSIGPVDGDKDQLETYNQLKKDLKQMLNLADDIPDEFLQSAENAELLEAAVNGDMTAVSELRANLAKMQVAEIGVKFNSEYTEDQLAEQIDLLTQEAPTLEFGATLNDSQYAAKLLEMMEAAGYSVAQMQQMFESLGWSPQIEYDEVDIETASQMSSTGWQEIVDPATGKITKVRTDGLQNYASDGKILVPRIGNASYTKATMPSSSVSADTDSGSSGSSSSETPSYWENPYDELYNLQEKINEALRTREALERNYQKLLKQEAATLSDIRKSYYDQINNLRAEANLQEQLAAGRLRQINNIGSELYTDDEGNRTSYSSLGVTKYASYNADTGLITIDWEGLEAIANDSSREEEGNAAEAYISRLEELVDSYEEVRDTLWDIEDEIEDLRDSAIDSYTSFEDRLLDAVINKYQAEIDSYQAMSDAIDEANTEVIDSLREQIELSRQIRDNTEKEEDIADKENRLAYLQRDTSGANDLEILKLQKEIDDARQSYSDTLIDQAIDQMQDDADLAAEQRARQIDTMTEQLEIMKENGDLWQEVYDLMNDAAAGDGALSPKSELVRLLEQTEAYESLSNIGKAQWWENVAEEFHAAWVGLSEAEDKYKTDANNDGTITNSGTSSAIANVATSAESVSTSTSVPEPTNESEYDEKTKYGVALAVCDGYWGNGQDRVRNLESKGFNYNEIQGIVNKIFKSTQSGAWYGKYYGITNPAAYKMSAFKEGGLADFTGPAWLDGTKSKPELILNAQDSANFIALKDILASLLNVQTTNGSLGKGGDNYFDIDISANIGSDYDVDKLTEKIKKDIYNDGQYRNVNTINFLR